MTENASSYNLSTLTSQQLDEMAQQVEAMNPYNHYMYKLGRLFGGNVLVLWTFCILLLLDANFFPFLKAESEIVNISTWSIAVACAVVFVINRVLLKKSYISQLSTRRILQEFVDVERESEEETKKRKWRYRRAMLGWMATLYIPLMVIIMAERGGEISIDISRWVQVVLCLCWVALYIRYSPEAYNLLSWQITIKRTAKEYEKKKSKFGILWVFMCILLILYITLFIVDILGMFGLKPHQLEGYGRRDLLAPILLPFWPFMIMAWMPLALLYGHKRDLTVFSLKKLLDKCSK
jgi:cation transport ATPase